MKLYFARHGESEANLLDEMSNRGWKHGLTAQGRQQAATLARKLQGQAIARLFCSPLMRAVQTAEILAEALDVPCEVADPLREYDCGVLEGKSDPASWAIYHAVFDDWLTRQRWERRIEQGESFLDMQARFAPFVERLATDERHAGESIALISHGGLYRCMLPRVLVNVEPTFAAAHPIGYTDYIVAETRRDGLVCVAWCGTRFDP